MIIVYDALKKKTRNPECMSRLVSILSGNCLGSKFSVRGWWLKYGSFFVFQMYYTGKNSFSPVYSLSFNRTSLFVALASGVRMLDFTV